MIEKIKHDLAPSIVVFLVALPLCMGIAIASGVPPAKGLLTGIIGGIVVGLLAGSPLQVSGPAAGLAVIVWELVNKHGLEALGAIVLGAGLLQLTAGFLKIGRWFQAVSPAVIQGMLAGIGVLILAGQFHVMLDDKPKGDGLHNLLAIPGAIAHALSTTDGSHMAALIGLLTLFTIIAWPFKRIPAPLAGVTVASLTAALFSLDIKFVTVPSNLAEAVTFPTFTFNPELLGAIVAMAFIASAETLLCASAVDQLHDGPRTDYDKELRAQGIGNMLCGLVGALPMTGVIVRSSANIDAGAKTRASAILHGVWLLAFVLLLPFLLQRIPTAALAAILVYIGFKLVNPQVIKRLKSQGNAELGIYAVTLVAIVATDLLTGVLVGLGLSLLKLLATQNQLEIDQDDTPAKVVLQMRGSATFLSLPRLASTLESLPRDREVHLKLDGLNHIDHACLDYLDSFRRVYQGRLVVDRPSVQP